MKKVLIIKSGYSETLENRIGRIVNLGDVLRTTVILNFFKEYSVSWIVDQKAIPLLKDNPYIERIIPYNQGSLEQLKKETFDIVVNFEKLPEIFSLCDTIKCSRIFGFRSNSCRESQSYIDKMSENVQNRKNNKDCYQKILITSIGETWNNEDYILGYQPQKLPLFDIGFNWTTGPRWSNKSWPLHYWKELESLLKEKYSISWQKGFDNLYTYMDWINSCQLIITADTLGLHLGLALKKRVLGLFGPTSPLEFYFYDRGTYLLPDSPYDCVSCFNTFCSKEKPCIEYITPNRVKESVEHEFKKFIFAE